MTTRPHTASFDGSRKQRRAAGRRRSRLQSAGLIAAGVILLASLLLLSARSDKNAGVRPSQIGQPLSNLALNDLSGKTVKLSDFAGEAVLINAWATWCPPCRAEMPALHAFYQAHQAEGFHLLAVNAGESRGAVQPFISQNGFTFQVLLDPGTTALNRLGIHSFPTSILVGRDGTVKNIHVGMFQPEDLQTEILPLLAQ
jgi:thiol-disulfide isomerase/thioredoxin